MTEARIAELERQLRAAQRNLDRLPMRLPPATPNAYDLGFIGSGIAATPGGGNSITPSGYTGIKKIATPLSSIATYDLTTIPALATVDGIGWGWHFRLGTFVLMLNDSRSGVGHDLPANAPVFISYQPIIISNQYVYVIALT